MIPLNILIVFYAERKFFLYLSNILTSSEDIYNHFPVNVLSENTYLISYFNSKVKNNKWFFFYYFKEKITTWIILNHL